MAIRKLPQRLCVGCKEFKTKKELVRIVKSPEGQISLDYTGKKPGRGAYICPNNDCLKKAIKTKGLERSLKAKIDEDFLVQLFQEIPLSNEKAEQQ